MNNEIFMINDENETHEIQNNKICKNSLALTIIKSFN